MIKKINKAMKMQSKQIKIRWMIIMILVLNKKIQTNNNLVNNSLDNKPILRLVTSKTLAFKETSNPNSKLLKMN